ncbi:MAG: radical SAM protein [Oscillospiraceae bacterium]|nr:radical SAM protein [Oscillospiraceae bacterium]
MDEQEKLSNPVIYKKDVVYRPPLESESALLEVGLGCNYRQCAFCDFVKDEFKMIPLSEIEENARLLGQNMPDKTAVFLLGQNNMHLKTDVLLEIMGYIHKYMPKVEEINLYGRVDDILLKGAFELKSLMESGMRYIHIGVESGSDEVLALMNKNFTAADTRNALKLLDEVSLLYHITYILGLGGRALWRKHVVETAKLFSGINPISVWALALKVWPDTKLHDMVKAGQFQELNYHEMLMEERHILAKSELYDCIYMDTTAMGKYSLAHILPEGREELLRLIDQMLAPFYIGEFRNL